MYAPHQDVVEIILLHLDAMIHRNQDESHEISPRTTTQRALLTPQYIVATKNMMQQPAKLYTMSLFVPRLTQKS